MCRLLQVVSWTGLSGARSAWPGNLVFSLSAGLVNHCQNASSVSSRQAAMLCHAASCHAASCHAASCHAASCHAASCLSGVQYAGWLS